MRLEEATFSLQKGQTSSRKHCDIEVNVLVIMMNKYVGMLVQATVPNGEKI
jgi:hypothetical protein